MGRMTFSKARTGKGVSGGGGMLQTLKWNIGDRLRLVFPVTEDGLIIFAKPYHPVLNKSVRLLKSDGSGTYPVNKIRCMHPFSQTNHKEGLKAAKSGEICLFCDLAKYESRRLWAEIEEEFGEDGFKELSKEEMKEYFEEAKEEDTVEASYYKSTDSEGNSQNITHYDMYILALQLTVKNGKVVKENGIAKYTPIVMPVSMSRLSKFKDGVDNALVAGTLSEEMLHPYIENEGTDLEEEVKIGFVDFMVNFPEASDKMTSGRNMSAQPVSEKLSAISDELVAHFEENADEIVKKADTLVNNFYVNLKPHTREEALDMIDKDEGYFEELEEEYRYHESREGRNGNEIPSDDDNDASIIQRVLDQNSDTEDEDEEDEEEKKPRKKKAKSSDAKKSKRSKKKVEEEDEEEEDEEDEKPKTRKRSPKSANSKKKSSGKKSKRPKKEEPEEDELDELDEDIEDESLFDE